MTDEEIIKKVIEEFTLIGKEQDEFIGNYYPVISGLLQKALLLSREQKDNSELKIEIAELKKERDDCFENALLIKKQNTAEILELIDEVLENRRNKIDVGIKDARDFAHLHSFVNSFEKELRQKITGG